MKTLTTGTCFGIRDPRHFSNERHVAAISARLRNEFGGTYWPDTDNLTFPCEKENDVREFLANAGIF